ncbi:Uncharacterised protein [Kingella potus]|uniref:Uncharacterized protein n=1 Tax=Kingella potus TaxID=265175 RepID=A0A377QZ51_9NEIS|nr:response regulator [Kingella potus]UOP01005.1 response regulator [Kingella potus]STR00674.1 Uncharacterised protein [Kingella potus]
MDNLIPKVKTVRVMLQEMGEQQNAVFKMAFKMHNTTNYEIIEPDSGHQPDMVLVDVDGGKGILAWHEAKKNYQDIPVVVFSAHEPVVTAPYLPKPVKFDTLFPILRSLAQGGNIFEVEQGGGAKQSELPPPHIDSKPRKTTIRRFNPQRGLLGALRASSERQQDTAVLVRGKPVLIVFPGIQRVLLTVSADELEKMCRDDHLSVVCKSVPDNPQWKEKAKVTIMSCLWQMAIWTAQGRLIFPMTPQTVFTLKRWPNLTRLASVPESMRLSAFLTKTSVNLNILYKVMPLDMKDILNYLAATYVTGYLATDSEFSEHSGHAGKELASDTMKVSTHVPDNKMSKDAMSAVTPSQTQPRGLLQRLMRKLSGGK